MIIARLENVEIQILDLSGKVIREFNHSAIGEVSVF
jgi:hypothetical protein